MIWNEGSLPEGLSLEALKRQHPSRPRNPIIADACFKGGYIDAWGRGIAKIINACNQAGLPEPEIKEQDGGLLVTLFKGRHTDEQLFKTGLNERQLKAIKFVKEKGKIRNKEYSDLVNINNRTSLRDLNDLCDKGIFKKIGTTGRNTQYILTRHKPDTNTSQKQELIKKLRDIEWQESQKTLYVAYCPALGYKTILPPKLFHNSFSAIRLKQIPGTRYLIKKRRGQPAFEGRLV